MLEAKSSNVTAAFAQAIFILKTLIKDSDVFLIEKVNDTTKFSEVNNDSFYVIVSPNILAEGVDKIGPYWLSEQVSLDDLPDN